MRGVGLTLLTCCALACADPPRVETQPKSAGPAPRNSSPSNVAPEPKPLEAARNDVLLARARARVRGGRVPDALRRELLDSPSPDHRHAARLLQAIAKEPPADVLVRTGEHPQVAVEIASAAELFDQESKTPAGESEPPIESEAEVEAEADPTEPDEWVPKLSALPVDSPVWWWFASGLVEQAADDADAAADGEAPDPRVELETIVGPMPMLLRERPPTAERPVAADGEGPRLVILTSLTLRPGDDGNSTSLEIAGAGSVQVGAQPLTGGRMRLWVPDAGAVPGFSSARPSAPGIEVIDVARRERRVEIELELGHGWSLRGANTLQNGASVEFGRSPTNAPAEASATPG